MLPSRSIHQNFTIFWQKKVLDSQGKHRKFPFLENFSSFLYENLSKTRVFFWFVLVRFQWAAGDWPHECSGKWVRSRNRGILEQSDLLLSFPVNSSEPDWKPAKVFHESFKLPWNEISNEREFSFDLAFPKVRLRINLLVSSFWLEAQSFRMMMRGLMNEGRDSLWIIFKFDTQQLWNNTPGQS